MVWPTTFEKYFKFYAKLFCCFKKKGRLFKIKIFGKLENLWFKTCVLGKHFISYSCIFISYIQCFEVSFQKNQVFFSKKFFFEFRLIQSNFRSIEVLITNLSEPLPGSIDRTCFSINRTSCFRFFKNSSLIVSNIFFKIFSSFSLSLRLGKAALKFFVFFFLNFCKVFLPQGRWDHFIPLFGFIFMFTCISSCI